MSIDGLYNNNKKKLLCSIWIFQLQELIFFSSIY